MRHLRTVIVLFVASFVAAAWAFAASPASGPRCNWVWSWTEGGNLRCFAFPPQAAAPVDTPTATHGLIIQHGAGVVDNAVTGDPSLGWQCVSDSGTLNVSTAEFAHCLHKPGNP